MVSHGGDFQASSLDGIPQSRASAVAFHLAENRRFADAMLEIKIHQANPTVVALKG